MPVNLMSITNHQETLCANLLDLLNCVDSSPITVKQKIRLYRYGICPRLTWSFRVLELPISWIKLVLESKATLFLKKWLRIPQGGNSHLLYLPKKDGGLALPALSTLYKQQQASRHVLLKYSSDISVRTLAAHDSRNAKNKFCPQTLVNRVQSGNTACSKRQLKSCVVHHILEDDSSTRRTHLTSLSVQGRVFCTDCDLTYWAEAVSSLPDREMRFACNAAIDTLPPRSLVQRSGILSVQTLRFPNPNTETHPQQV